MTNLKTFKGAREEHQLCEQKRRDITQSLYFLQQDIHNDSTRRQAGLRGQYTKLTKRMRALEELHPELKGS